MNMINIWNYKYNKCIVLNKCDGCNKYYKCNECEIVYLWPFPTIEEENQFYLTEFEKFMENRSAKERDWSSAGKHISSNQDNVERRMKIIELMIPDLPNTRSLFSTIAIVLLRRVESECILLSLTCLSSFSVLALRIES